MSVVRFVKLSACAVPALLLFSQSCSAVSGSPFGLAPHFPGLPMTANLKGGHTGIAAVAGDHVALTVRGELASRVRPLEDRATAAPWPGSIAAIDARTADAGGAAREQDGQDRSGARERMETKADRSSATEI